MKMSGRYVPTTKQISNTSITYSWVRPGSEICTRRGGYIEISWHGSIIYWLGDSRANAIILMRLIPAIYHSQSRPVPSSFKDCLCDRSSGTGERLAGSITCRLSCRASRALSYGDESRWCCTPWLQTMLDSLPATGKTPHRESAF